MKAVRARQNKVLDPLDSVANVGYGSVGSVDGQQDSGGHRMYFTWAAAHRHSAVRCSPATYVCGNADGVASKRIHEGQLEYCVPGIAHSFIRYSMPV